MHILDVLQGETRQEKTFSPEGWNSFEDSLSKLGFAKKDPEKYLLNVATFHGQEVLVRRASMHRLLESLESEKGLDIIPLDREPNVTLLGKDVSGVESALASGFGWVVEEKVAGVFGFTNEASNMKVENLDVTSPSLKKKHGNLMRRVSGKLERDDVLFMLFRIHKSAFPERLLEDEDFNDLGEVNSFIIRLYAKSRQAH